MKKAILFLFALFASFAVMASTTGAPGEYHFVHPEAKATWTADLPKDVVRVSETCVASPREGVVYLLAELCGLGKGYECEFILLSQLSDRAYESVAITWDQPSTIAKAVETLGVTKGIPANPDRGLGMAKGERFTVEVKSLSDDKGFRPISDFVIDECSTPAQALFARGCPYVGGTDFDDIMPAAVISAYTEERSLFGLPYHAPKSIVYGLFRAKENTDRGTPIIVALRWQKLPNDQSRVYHHTLTLDAKGIANPNVLLNELRKLCEDPRDVFLHINLDPTLKLAEIVPFARLVLALEAEGGFTLDAPKAGQLPLRAFTPNDAWRDRESRIFQPWEIEISPGEGAPNVTLCQILEDWTVEGLDPELTRKCYPGMSVKTIAEVMKRLDANDGKIYVTFFYTTPGVTVGDLTPYAEAIKTMTPTQWIFIDSQTTPNAEK